MSSGEQVPNAERAKRAREQAAQSAKRRLQQPSAAARGVSKPRRRGRIRHRTPVTDQQRGLAIAAVGVLLVVGLIAMITLFSIDASDGGSKKADEAKPVATREAPPVKTPTTGRHGLSAAEAATRKTAIATLRAGGFEAVNPGQWEPDNQLRVLVGKATKRSGLSGERAFFFLGGDFLGTDAKQSSQSLKIVRQSDTLISIKYATYNGSDEACCPSGSKVVRFRYTDQSLKPLDQIPDAAVRLRSGN